MSATGAIDEWNRGSGLQDGWQARQNTGTAIDSLTGLEITFTGAPQNSNSTTSSYLVGDAATNTQNFNFDDRGNITTKGLKIEDTNLSDDGNLDTLTLTNGRRVLSGGTLANYQLLTFSFSTPVIIDSDTRFFIDDIDDNSSTGASETYIDSVGIEAFNSPIVGTPGTGIDPNFSFESSTNLTTSTIEFDDGSGNGNGQTIDFVYNEIDNNRNNANIGENRAYYDFGSTEEVQSIALYFFNGLPTTSVTSGTSGHAVVLGGSFDLDTASVPFEFSPGWGLLLSGGGLLGARCLKQRRQGIESDVANK